jgi:hypothetical protein
MTMPERSLDSLKGPKRHHTAVACVVLALCVSFPAMASDKELCVAAHELYQQLSLQRQTVQAREQLVICADPVCPRLVREDCTQWLVEMDKRLVSVPAPPPASSAVHPCATQDVPRVHATAPPRHSQSARSPGTQSSLVAQASWVTGALGIAALGSAAYLGIGGWQDANTLRRTCAPNCDPSQVSAIRTRLVIADISLLAGLGLGALTAWLVWGDHAAKSTVAPNASDGLSATVGRGGAQVRYSTNF